MKFVCDRCQTRYSIADEKVRQRIIRIRCKSCGNVITVQSGGVVAAPQDATQRLAPVGRSDSPAAAGPSSKLSRPPAPPRASEWFVAVDGVEQGPLSCTDAAKCIVSLKPEQAVHVWKEGMDGWKRPGDVAIIAQEISALRLAPTGPSSHTPVVQGRGGSSTTRRLAPADSGAGLRVPTTRPKPPPPGGSDSGPKSEQTGIPGSGPEPAQPMSGSGLKTAPPMSGSALKTAPHFSGSGPKRVPPPIPGSGLKTAPPPIPRSGPKPAPPAIPGSGLKVVPPVSGSGAKPTPAARPGLEQARPRITASVPLPGGLSPKKGPALPGLTPSSPPPPSPAHALPTERDKAPPTAPEKRPSRVQDVAASMTPAPSLASPSSAAHPLADDEFDQAQKTPLPVKPLPSIAVPAEGEHAVGNWPPPPALAGPRASLYAAAPAPSAGSLFGNVAALPAPLFPTVHAEAGLSKLTGLAGLAHRHRHLKYVVAASVVVILVILVILFSWRGEAGKVVVPPMPEHGARGPEPTSPLGETEPPAPDETAVAPEARFKGRTPARGAAKRSAVAHPSGHSAKAAAVGEDPFERPSPPSRLAERPVPVQMPGQSRAGSPAGKQVSQEQIAAVVRNKDNQGGLKTCYERALRRDGRLRTGRLDITVSVGEGGTVQRVQVHGPTDFLIIDGCLKSAIRHWRFPANAEDYATSFPLILQGG